MRNRLIGWSQVAKPEARRSLHQLKHIIFNGLIGKIPTAMRIDSRLEGF
jgi:hypothetical protein